MDITTINYYKRIKMIHINDHLDETLQRFTCAHELGHALLHHDINTTFLKAKTFFSTNNKNAIEIISLNEYLSVEVKQVIKDAIPDLIVDSSMALVATAKYRKFIQSAADYTKDGLKKLLFDVVTESVKKSIWD